VNIATETSLSPQTGDVAPGHVLGRYELLIPIASGGMAMVWAARQKGTRGFQKIVAVKTMLPKLSEDIQFEQMFLDEASLASQVHHPHIVEILDLGEQDSVLFLVMEWIDGVPLNQLMKASRALGGVAIPVAVRIVIQACAGLHAAHELRGPDGKSFGLVHRDVSPQNIMVTYEGVAKVIDFGVAKATAMGSGATQAGQIKGKVAYMAPEQVKGGEIDRRVDIFAMGIVLYALTTGKHPFRRESEAATMYNICAPQPVMPPRKVLPEYPIELEHIVLRALAKDPDKRYQSLNDMLRDLDQLPVAQRASTDEEVANFVREVLGNRGDERRVALAEAMLRADENAKNRATPLTFNAGVVHEAARSTAGAVSGFSGIGLGIELPTGSTVSTLGMPSSRKKLIVAGGVAGAVAILGTIVALSSQQNVPQVPGSAMLTGAAAAPSTSLSTQDKAPQPSTSSSISPTAAAMASALSGNKPPAVGRLGPGVWPPRPPPAQPPPASTRPKSWRNDPGF
jgi:eukaryotic-like serine/threonine-protein kinase